MPNASYTTLSDDRQVDEVFAYDVAKYVSQSAALVNDVMVDFSNFSCGPKEFGFESGYGAISSQSRRLVQAMKEVGLHDLVVFKQL